MEGLKEWGKVVGAKGSCLLANRNVSKKYKQICLDFGGVYEENHYFYSCIWKWS